jgi:hypothetical protein
MFCNETVTYEGSSANAPGGTGTAKIAVSCTDDCVGIEKSATAEVASAELNADDEGEVALGRGYATNNVRGVLIPVIRNSLRDRYTRDEGRNHKGKDDRFGVHVGRT